MLLIPRWFIKGPVRGEFAVAGTPAEVEARLLATVKAAAAHAEQWDADEALEAWRSYPGVMVRYQVRLRLFAPTGKRRQPRGRHGIRPKLRVLVTPTATGTVVHWELCHQAADIAFNFLLVSAAVCALVAWLLGVKDAQPFAIGCSFMCVMAYWVDGPDGAKLREWLQETLPAQPTTAPPSQAT